jgi:hypothetical protein
VSVGGHGAPPRRWVLSWRRASLGDVLGMLSLPAVGTKQSSVYTGIQHEFEKISLANQ